MNLLKEKRLEKRLTLEEVGKLVGVAKSTVSKWESGEIENMGRDKIIKLASVLGVSPMDILTMEAVRDGDEVLDIYGELDDRRRWELIGYAKRLLEEQKKPRL